MSSENEVSQAKEELLSAQAEIEAIRAKLHNAVRKGKTIEAEKKKKDLQIEELNRRIQDLQARLSEADFQKQHNSETERLQLSELQGLYQAAQQQALTAQAQKTQAEEQLQAAQRVSAELQQKLQQVAASAAEELTALQQERQLLEETLRQQVETLQEESATLRHVLDLSYVEMNTNDWCVYQAAKYHWKGATDSFHGSRRTRLKDAETHLQHQTVNAERIGELEAQILELQSRLVYSSHIPNHVHVSSLPVARISSS